ncbi:MAG: T9SS type A sorting domain-containing protein [Melioribacteraceae bacterium]
MKLSRSTVFISLCIAVLQSTIVQAQWKNVNGLYGKSINILYSIGNRILAGTNEGLFYSTDCGLSWNVENVIIGQNNIKSFSYNGKKLYAAGSNKIYSSIDYGTTWNPENLQIDQNLYLRLIHAFDSKICIASGSGFMFSSDDGKSFSTRNDGLYSTSIQSITSVKNTIIVGTDYGIYKSTNDGMQWEPAGNGAILGRMGALVTLDSIVYACSDRVYKSTDSGLTWNDMSNGIPSQSSIYNLTSIDSNIYALTSSGIYCSTDKAKTWMCITWKLTQTYFKSIVKNNNKFIITTLSGLLFTSDGDNWSQINSGLTSAVNSLSKYNNGVIAASSSGVYFVEPIEKGWKTTQIGLSGKSISSICNVGDVIFAGTNDGIYISTNFGQSWSLSANGLKTTNVVRVLYVSNNKIYAGTQTGELFVSENYGQTWACIRSIQHGEISRSISVFGSTILLGTSGNFYGEFGNVYKSTNNGSSWEEFHEIFYKTDIYSIAYTGSTIYLGTGAGLFISNDTGLNWKRINKTSISAVFASGNSSVASNKEVSNDYGVSWKKYDSGLPIITYINSIAESGTYLYFGADNGVYAIPSQEILTNIEASDKALPSNYTLSQNFPNPFNPETTISYSLPKSEHVTLKVYDVLGREVATLVDEYKQTGTYNSKFSIINYNMSSGVYFYQLRAGNPSAGSGQGFAETKKFVLLK